MFNKLQKLIQINLNKQAQKMDFNLFSTAKTKISLTNGLTAEEGGEKVKAPYVLTI